MKVEIGGIVYDSSELREVGTIGGNETDRHEGFYPDRTSQYHCENGEVIFTDYSGMTWRL